MMTSPRIILDSLLPNSISTVPNLTQKDAQEYVKHVLKTTLPKSDSKSLDTELKWTFPLEKRHSENKKSRQIRKKKTFLTRKERKRFNLLKLPKKGWSYTALQQMRDTWKQYMREHLDLQGGIPSYNDSKWSNFSTTLAKAELIGAELTVTRSRTPSVIGLRGTVVLETKSTFQIVTHDSALKTILKEPSVFTFNIDDSKFTFFGKHIVTKPGERSVKKIKSHMIPDL